MTRFWEWLFYGTREQDWIPESDHEVLSEKTAWNMLAANLRAFQPTDRRAA